MKKVMHNPHTYDPQKHITVAQLRGLGFYLSEMLPDAAFVRRCAVGLAVDESIEDEAATLTLRVLEPFTTALAVA